MARMTLALLATAALTIAGCTGASDDKGETPVDLDVDDDGFETDEDCDDENPEVNPDAEERCDEIDNNCDEQIDENSATDAATWYADADEDGFGDADTTETACTAPEGYLDESTDCDDDDEDVNPDAAERCDEIDNNCDGEIDEDAAEDAETWYADNDGDGFGNARRDQTACVMPEGYVADDTDCDDTSASVFPGAVDLCNGVDDDCDDESDEDAMVGMSFVTVVGANRAVYEIDPATATPTQVSELSGGAEFPISSLATNFAGDAFIEDSDAHRLFELDTCSGVMSRVGYTEVGGLCGMTYVADGAIIGVDGTNDQLVQIDPATGAATAIGPLTVDGATLDIKSCGLAYDCKTDRVVMLDSKGKTFYDLDLSSGAATLVLTTDVSFPYAAVSYDPTDGSWLASSGSKLYRYDLSAGTYETVGSFGTDLTVNNLDLHPTCPVSTDTGG